MYVRDKGIPKKVLLGNSDEFITGCHNVRNCQYAIANSIIAHFSFLDDQAISVYKCLQFLIRHSLTVSA